MENRIIINKNDKYLKGNLHIHTTFSDGRCTVDEVTRLYRDNDFDFLAITDHDVIYRGENIVNGVLLLPGVEFAGTYDGDDCVKVSSYSHFNLIGSELKKFSKVKKFKYKNIQDINNVLNKINLSNIVVQYNHPNFSRFFDNEYLEMNGFELMEIYNHKDYIKETSMDDADAIMRKYLFYNKRVFVTAGDDYHGIEHEWQKYANLCRSFVMVNAELDIDAIVKSLKNGNFYASTGPLINDLRIIDNTIYLECSKVKRIIFYNFSRNNKHIIDNDGITSCSYEIKGNERYIWIKIIDFDGNAAWSQPIYLN